VINPVSKAKEEQIAQSVPYLKCSIFGKGSWTLCSSDCIKATISINIILFRSGYFSVYEFQGIHQLNKV